MKRDRCPTCHGPVPPLKTCANPSCGKTFYRSENGRASTSYCTVRCGTAHRVRRWRANRTTTRTQSSHSD